MSIQDSDPAPPNYELMAEELLKIPSSVRKKLPTVERSELKIALFYAEHLSSLPDSDLPEAHSSIQKAYATFIQPVPLSIPEVVASETMRECYPTLQLVGGYSDNRALAGLKMRVFRSSH